MRYKLSFLAGLTAGYVLGARAGKERYDQLKRAAQQLAGNPKVQQARTDLQQNAVHLFSSAKDKVSGKFGDYDMPSWMPGRHGRSEEETDENGPGPASAPGYATDDPWAAATESDPSRQ